MAEERTGHTGMQALAILMLAALLEVGGDALVRWGLKGGGALGFLLGAGVLLTYSVAVNLPRWDFGRLLGVYIAVFFVVSQLFAFLVFHEPVKTPACIGGALIVAGALLMTFWKA